MEKIAIIYVEAQGMNEQLRSLFVPEEMEMQFYPIPENESVAASFQNVMEQADAKYKVYISGRVELLRREILADMITAFHAHPEVSLLGLSGTKRVLTSAITYQSPERCGILLDAEQRPLAGRVAAAPCEIVQALDGYILATQQDVAWRKDLLLGTMFLGVSASVEHRRAGHEVAILSQATPACCLLDNKLAKYDGEQDAVLDEYSKDLYPLVSVVIPTYQRPKFFQEALESAQKQTYRNLDIFITDNSHNEETKDVYEKHFSDDPRIYYEFHPNFDAAGNWNRATEYDNPQAEYVNWLMDDDLFAPEKIARMMDYYFTYPDVTLVTSYRTMIDEKGNVLPDKSWSKPIVENTARLSGGVVGRLMLQNIINYLGEPTTALICKKYMHDGHLGWTGNEGKYRISDFTTWFCLMSQGDLIYITEPLSSFRQHAHQQHQNLDTHFGGLICWTMMMREAIEENVFLKEDNDKRKAIIQWLKYAGENLEVMKTYPEEYWNKSYVQDFLKVYAGMAAALTNGYHIEYRIDPT